MTPEKWEKVGELFHAASELPADERPGFLAKECDGDDELRSEVDSLLAAGSDAGGFISDPIVGKFIPEFAKHAQALSPGNAIGHYVIERSIGSGGMGEVYLATDTKLGRYVALKTLPPSFASDPNFLRRFRTEAQAAANLNHPNVATVYSVEEFDGIPFITMEYVNGDTLDHVMPNGGLELANFLEWFEPIADALSHAHEKGVIHRDIKPGNIMISAEGVPKILDFGLALIERSLVCDASTIGHITAPGQIIGTPSYMSPEQAEGADVDQRSDIFSFGTVMYEALTGKRPFRGTSQGLIVRAVIHDAPKPISRLKPGVPDVIAKMIAKCLQKLPGNRFQSMHEVRSILRESKAASDAGVSMDSFARRFYRETASSSKLWWVGFSLVVIVLSVGAWYYSSAVPAEAPFSFDRISMRRVTQSNNIAVASISPDGKSVAYVTTDEKGERTMWLRRINDTNPLLLVAPQSVQYWSGPMFSHDGEQIFYINAGRAALHGSIFRVSSLGGQPRKLVNTVNHLGSVSPDGQRILYVRNGSPIQILSANTSDGGDEQVIQAAPALETSYRDPTYSFDGKSIYYIKRELVEGIEYWSLISIPSTGGAETEILRQRERIAEMYVLKDSAGLLMCAIDPVSNLQQLYHVSKLDGKRIRITNDTNNYGFISVDQEEKSIVTIQRSDAYRVFVGDANDLSSIKPLTREPNAHQNLEWAPDGRIVFDAYENNRIHIWISDISGKSVQQLTDSGSDNLEPKVSGDGRYIVFTSDKAGFDQVWRMDIDGRNQVLLADAPGITQKPRFAADGQTVVFFWLHDGVTSISKVPVTGGKVEVIADTPGHYSYFWAMSPDGTKIAYTYRDEQQKRSKVAVRDVNSTEPFVIMDIWPTGFLKWAPDGKSLYYHERQAVEAVDSKVFQIDPANRVPKVLFSAEPELVGDLAFSRDGKKIAVIKGKSISDVVMLTRLPNN